MINAIDLISKSMTDHPSLNHACQRTNLPKVTIFVSQYNDFCQSSIKTCTAAQYLQIMAIPNNDKVLISYHLPKKFKFMRFWVDKLQKNIPEYCKNRKH